MKFFLTLAFFLCLPLIAFAKINVIISTDVSNGLNRVENADAAADIDDGIAILNLANSPKYKIAALVVQFGNSDAAREYEVAMKLVEKKGLQVPVIKGSEKPLSIYGPVRITPGARFMAHYLQSHKAVIMGIAPVSDIASLLYNFPEVKHNIIQVYAEVGRTKPMPLKIGPEQDPVNEMNYVKDPRAAYILMHSDVPVTVLSFGAIHQVLLTSHDFKKIGQHNTPAARWLVSTSKSWFKFWTTRFKERGIHPWDAVVSYYMSHPEGFECEKFASSIIASNYPIDFIKKYPYMLRENTWLMFGKQYEGEQQLYCGHVKPKTIQLMHQWIIKNAY